MGPRQPSTRLQALVGENLVAIETRELHRVNTCYTSLDKVWPKLRVGSVEITPGNDQDVLCALGDIALALTLVAGYYNFDKELLQADQLLFNRFKKIQVEKSIRTAAEVIDILLKNSLYEITPEFSKVASILAIIPATSCSADSGG